MNNLTVLNKEDCITMSSREIAELTGKRHDSVMRTINNLESKGLLESPQFVNTKNDQNGQLYKQALLCKIDSLVLIARLSPEFTKAVVDRWQELEKKEAPALPTPTQLALMVIKAEEEKEAALLEVDRIQGICQTITAQFKTGMTPAKFCKQLNGVNSQQVNKTLIKLHKLRVDGNGYSPTSIARDDLFKANYGDFAPYPTLLLKGAKWLYKAYLGGKLPMKKTWNGELVHMVFEGQ